MPTMVLDAEENGASDHADEETVRAKETRGQMLQRHKRELKACKDAAKRMGKKRKEEAAKMEEELKKKHEKELIEKEETEAVLDRVEQVVESLANTGVSTAENKITKAQKRRQKKMEEEAIREKRIEEERLEMGETDQELEEGQLHAKLEPLGLQVKEIQADGHCMYRSVEDQLKRAGKETSYQDLRKQAADHMREHREEFMPFVLAELETTESESRTPEDIFATHCMEVESTASWGGQVELHALSRSLHTPIEVYSAMLPLMVLGTEFEDTGPPLRVAYLQHAFGLGQHYNSVVPVCTHSAPMN